MNVQKEVASPALSAMPSINGEEGSSNYDFEDTTWFTPEKTTNEPRLNPPRVTGGSGSSIRIAEGGRPSTSPNVESSSTKSETTPLLGSGVKRSGSATKKPVPEKAHVSQKGTTVPKGGTKSPEREPKAPPHGSPGAACPASCAGGSKAASPARSAESSPRRFPPEKPKTIAKEQKNRGTPNPEPAQKTGDKTQAKGRISKEIFTWAKEKHGETVKALLASSGIARVAIQKQIEDMFAQEQGARDAQRQIEAEAREDAQDDDNVDEAPKPKNVPIELWPMYRHLFDDDETGSRSFEVALPDVHTWWFFVCCIICFILSSSMCFISYTSIPLSILSLSIALVERLCTLRWDVQYSQANTATGRRGVFRELTKTLQILHFLFLLLWLCVVVCFYVYAVSWLGHVLFGRWWMTFVDVFCLVFVLLMSVLGYFRLRQELISVLRQRLTLRAPTSEGVTRGRRLNDPDRDSYVADVRTESDKATDLTIPALAIGEANFSVEVAKSTEEPPFERGLSLYTLIKVTWFKFYGHGDLSYSMAELLQYMTGFNTNILMDYKTMHERMQNYRSSFARVAFGAHDAIRVQDLRTNSAWMAAFIALSQQLILASVAGKALPLTVLA